MRRLLTSVFAGCLLGGFLAIPASATAAPKLPDVEPQSLVFPAGEYCDFAIQYTYWDAQKLHDNAGAIVFTGPFVVTLENLDSDDAEVVTLNAPGPLLRDGTEVGPWVIGQPASLGVGDPFLIYHRGRVTFNANNTIASIHGKTVDLCAVLS
jgi:hypothetical protein